jgi:hypothetical protein
MLPHLALLTAACAVAQPSVEAPPPSRAPVPDAALRREAYHRRVDEVLHWRASGAGRPDPATMDMAAIAIKLTLRQDLEGCSRG